MDHDKKIHRRGRRERRGALLFSLRASAIFRTIPEDNKKSYYLIVLFDISNNLM